jgi:hypothetical protein
MSQLPGSPSTSWKPQPSIYTLLLIVAILALLVTLGFVMWNLMSASGYGMSFGDMFNPFGGAS